MQPLTAEGVSEHISSLVWERQITDLKKKKASWFALPVLQQKEPLSFKVFNKLHTVPSIFWVEVQQGKTAKAGQEDK